MMKWVIFMSSAMVCIGLTASCILLGGAGSVWQLHSTVDDVSPAIRRGSLVLIRQTAAATLKAGDIAGYQRSGSRQVFIGRITRVMGIGSTSRYVFSDTTESVGPLVPANQVVGRAVFTLPYLGKVSNFLHSWPGLLVGLYLPALALLVFEVTRLVKITEQNSFGHL